MEELGSVGVENFSPLHHEPRAIVVEDYRRGFVDVATSFAGFSARRTFMLGLMAGSTIALDARSSWD